MQAIVKPLLVTVAKNPGSASCDEIISVLGIFACGSSQECICKYLVLSITYAQTQAAVSVSVTVISTIGGRLRVRRFRPQDLQASLHPLLSKRVHARAYAALEDKICK